MGRILSTSIWIVPVASLIQREMKEPRLKIPITLKAKNEFQLNLWDWYYSRRRQMKGFRDGPDGSLKRMAITKLHIPTLCVGDVFLTPRFESWLSVEARDVSAAASDGIKIGATWKKVREQPDRYEENLLCRILESVVFKVWIHRSKVVCSAAGRG